MSDVEPSLVWLQGIVDDQAHDPELWFDPATLPEAHLQRALRSLHEAIEAVQPEEPDA